MIDCDHPNSPFDPEPEYFDECTPVGDDVYPDVVGRYDGYNLPLDYRG